MMTDTQQSNMNGTDTDTEPAESDVVGADVESKLDAALTTIHSHADEIASVLHSVTGEEYGKFKTTVDGHEWVIKQESGDVSWLRQTVDGDQRYVISTRDEPAPDVVAQAMQEYPEFVEAFNNWVEGINDTISTAAEDMVDLDAVEETTATESLVSSRDALTDDAWQAAHVIAETVQDITGNSYGTFKAEVNDRQWKLKYEDTGRAKYLQIGDTYVLGRDDPHPSDLTTLIEGFEAFVESVNTWMQQQEEHTQFELDITRVEGDADGDD